MDSLQPSYYNTPASFMAFIVTYIKDKKKMKLNDFRGK